MSLSACGKIKSPLIVFLKKRQSRGFLVSLLLPTVESANIGMLLWFIKAIVASAYPTTTSMYASPNFSSCGRLRRITRHYMSQVLIQQYLNQLQDLRNVSGTHREMVVREAFKDLLKSWARSRDLIFVPEYDRYSRQRSALCRRRLGSCSARAFRLAAFLTGAPIFESHTT